MQEILLKTEKIVGRERLVVYAPRHPQFDKHAADLGGHLANGRWRFDPAAASQVRQALLDTYGADGSGEPVVRVDMEMIVRAAESGTFTTIFALGRRVARRDDYDKPVTLGEDVELLQGNFRTGCYDYEPNRGCMDPGDLPVSLLVRNVPWTLAEQAIAVSPHDYAIYVERGEAQRTGVSVNAVEPVTVDLTPDAVQDFLWLKKRLGDSLSNAEILEVALREYVRSVRRVYQAASNMEGGEGE